MADVLFFIGNGFDLNLGLKTSFKDVLDEYCAIETKDESILEFQREINRDYPNWADFEKAMGIYAKKFEPNNQNVYFSQIDSFRNVLREKLLREESYIDYHNQKEKISSAFTRSLTSFQNYLSQKSKEALSPFIPTSLQSPNESIGLTYRFIVFNYTNVFDKCIELIKKDTIPHFTAQSHVNSKITINGIIGGVLHIHGTLKSPFILGVDNIEQIENTELSVDENFQWRIVKPIINEELGENSDIRAKKMIDNSSVICIFGMSIGATDKTWWDCVYNWLKANISRQLVIFYYAKEFDMTNPGAIVSRKKEVQDLFFTVVGADGNDRKKCENRIHIARENGEMFKVNALVASEQLAGALPDLIKVVSNIDPNLIAEINKDPLSFQQKASDIKKIYDNILQK